MRAIIALLLLAALVLSYSGCATMMANREGEEVARNNPSGVAPGAEPRTLGPEDATMAVLCVHGFIGGSNNFSNLPDKLAEAGYRVKVMRLPGHGTSARELAKVQDDELIEAVKSEAATLRNRYDRLVLMGHSMGGALSTIAASEISLDGLILAAPYFRVPYKWYYILPAETWNATLGWLVPYIYKGQHFLQINNKAAKDKIYSYTWVPTAAARTLRKLGKKAGDEATLARISCPILLLHAPKDVAASFKSATQAVAKTKASSVEIVELPNSNHHIFWDYDAVLIEESVLDFCEKISSGPPPDKESN